MIFLVLGAEIYELYCLHEMYEYALSDFCDDVWEQTQTRLMKWDIPVFVELVLYIPETLMSLWYAWLQFCVILEVCSGHEVRCL